MLNFFLIPFLLFHKPSIADEQVLTSVSCGEFADLFTDDEYDQITSKPVRYEIRDLPDDIWNEFADAIWIMKTTPQDIGRNLYGDDFFNYDRLLCQHMTAVADSRGDQGHFDPNFIIWHRVFGMELENSIWAIKPELKEQGYGMPYWNFALDSETLENSEIFSDQYFGSANGDPDFYNQVTDGKFAYWRVNFEDDGPNSVCDIRNNYGYMRGVTNGLDTLYTTRYGFQVCDLDFPTLGDSSLFESCKNERTYIDWNFCTYWKIHAFAHTAIGGTTKIYSGQPDIDYNLYPEYEDVTNINVPLCLEWYLKAVVTDGGLFASAVPDFNCYSNIRDDDNLCEVGVDDRDSCFVDLVDNINNQCVILGETLELADRELTHIVGDFGDVFSSANDPIFWVHHSNVDRVFTEWQIRNYDLKDTVYGGEDFAADAWSEGGNVDDIMNSNDPFINIFNDNDEPITIRQAFEETDFLTNSYVYDTIINAITRPDECNESSESSETQRNRRNNGGRRNNRGG